MCMELKTRLLPVMVVRAASMNVYLEWEGERLPAATLDACLRSN